jgi:hypothetical protein
MPDHVHRFAVFATVDAMTAAWIVHGIAEADATTNI